MAIKSQHNLSVECIDKLLGLFDDVLPENHKMPKNLYECKRLLSGLKMPYVKIDACVNDCMIYYKQDENKEKCDFCEESRYVAVEEPTHRGRKRKPIAHVKFWVICHSYQGCSGSAWSQKLQSTCGGTRRANVLTPVLWRRGR